MLSVVPLRFVMAIFYFAMIAALFIGVTSCGLALRDTVGQGSSEVQPVDPYMTPRPAPALPRTAIEPLVVEPGQTVVSLTFDDGRASNAMAGRMLAEHGLAGTFFVSSGKIGEPGFLTLSDLDELALLGNEIGGHTAMHIDVESADLDEARRQVCIDRTTLVDWGFPVRSFSYPFASADEDLQRVVAGCGYNSARSLGELQPVRVPVNTPPDLTCEFCANTETIPPANPMYTRAPAQYTNDWTMADLERRVDEAAAAGGWLQLTFHGLCPSDCSDLSYPVEQFDAQLRWLAERQAAGVILVRTVGEVIGGPVQPAVSEPLPAPVPDGINGLTNPGFEDHTGDTASCWMPSSFGDNVADFTLVPEGRNGGTASRVEMRDHIDGDAKLIQFTDFGECAPAVASGHRYTVSAWYTSTAPTSFSVQYRLPRGGWVYGTQSPPFAPSNDFTLAQWALPPIPQNVSAISFGLSLRENGVLVTDDYSIIGESTGAVP